MFLQLKGGILNYLKKTERKDSLWKGECFVFDNRVSLKHKLKHGTYSVCSGCRMTFQQKIKNLTNLRRGSRAQGVMTHSQIHKKQDFA